MIDETTTKAVIGSVPQKTKYQKKKKIKITTKIF